MLYPPDLRNRRPFGATANPRGALGALRTFIEQVAPPPASTAPLDNGAVFRLLPGQPAQLREGLTMPQMEPVLEQAAPEVLVRAGRDLVSSRSDAPPPWSAKIPQPRHDPRGALVRALGLSAAGLGLVATAAEGPNGRGTVPALLAGVAQGAQGVVEGIDAEAVRRSNGFLEGIRRQAETEQERAERERRETAATERRAAELAGTQAGDLLDAGEFDRARALLIASNWSDADADALIAARRARRQEEVERENRRDAPDGLTPADLRAERDNVREDARELAEFGDVDGAITLLTGANIYTPERAETVARGWQNDAEVDRRTRARLSRPPAPSGGRSAGRRPASSGIRTTRTPDPYDGPDPDTIIDQLARAQQEYRRATDRADRIAWGAEVRRLEEALTATEAPGIGPYEKGTPEYPDDGDDALLPDDEEMREYEEYYRRNGNLAPRGPQASATPAPVVPALAGYDLADDRVAAFLRENLDPDDFAALYSAT